MCTAITFHCRHVWNFQRINYNVYNKCKIKIIHWKNLVYLALLLWKLVDYEMDYFFRVMETKFQLQQTFFHHVLLWVFHGFEFGDAISLAIPRSEPCFYSLSYDVISHVNCTNRWENGPFFLCVVDIDCFLLKNGRLMLSLSPQKRFCWEGNLISSSSELRPKL